MQFAENFYWYSLWKPYRGLFGRGYSCNVFVIKQENEIWLVDVGTDAMFKRKILIRKMKKDGLDPKLITKIFITHAHPDHTAALPFFIKNYKSKIYIHKNDAQMLKEGYKYFWDKQYEAMGDFRKDFYFFKKETALKFSKYPMGDMPKIDNSITLDDNQIVSGEKFSLKAILTPGHTEGHLSYYCPELKAFFCGDLIDPGYQNKPPLNFPAVDYDKFCDSIKKILNLKVEYFCAGHAKKVHLGQKFHSNMVKGVLSNLELAKMIVMEQLKFYGKMRIKYYKGNFPRKVWARHEHTSVAFSVLKSLEKQGKVKRKGLEYYL